MATGFQTALLLSLLAVAPLLAQEAGSPRGHRMGVIFGGAFENFEIAGPLEGAERTRMAAYYEWDYGVRPFTKKTWEERGLDWERFFPVARALADGIVARVEPKLVRDHRGVALYAILADEDPFLTSVLLSSKLHERFRETLGDRILVVLLEQNRLYLFPATGGTLAEFGPALVEEYRRSSFPVSLEIFLLDREGFRPVGELERPGPELETLEMEGEAEAERP